jgi:hypothetical protein
MLTPYMLPVPLLRQLPCRAAPPLTRRVCGVRKYPGVSRETAFRRVFVSNNRCCITETDEKHYKNGATQVKSITGYLRATLVSSFGLASALAIFSFITALASFQRNSKSLSSSNRLSSYSLGSEIISPVTLPVKSP